MASCHFQELRVPHSIPAISALLNRVRRRGESTEATDNGLSSKIITINLPFCHRYCTAYVVSNGEPVTLPLTYVRSDEKEPDTVKRVLDRVGTDPFETDLLLADCDFDNERVVRRARDLATTGIHSSDLCS